jgi:arabinose-5-phosphate isomerase
MRTEDLMRTEWPKVATEAGLLQLLQAMTTGRLGMATVMEGGRLLGVITDGDLRRGLERAQSEGRNPLELQAKDLMSRNPVLVPRDTLAIEAANLMEQRKITFLVVGEAERPVGILHIHDLLSSKVL